jgi:hypothetical protein
MSPHAAFGGGNPPAGRNLATEFQIKKVAILDLKGTSFSAFHHNIVRNGSQDQISTFWASQSSIL